MDVSTACDISFSEFLASCYEYDLKQPYTKHKQCSGSVNLTSDSVVTELGNALSGILHVQDAEVQFSGHVLPSDGEKMCYQEKDVSSEEIEVQQNNHLNTPSNKNLNASSNKNLNKCATFPCSRGETSCLVAVDESNEIPDTALDGESSKISKSPVCTRCTSLPTHSELSSALKGSREKQGIPIPKLSVTWAPDVYDPPATSLSHTVKNRNQQRSRNKKNSKHKHKGKSSRGSYSEKQYRKHVGSPNFRSKSLSTCDRVFVGGYNQSPVELMDLAVTGQDSKCSSSFLRTSPDKVHISIAEAT